VCEEGGWGTVRKEQVNPVHSLVESGEKKFNEGNKFSLKAVP
jgi:hypothetical protein